MPDRLEILTTAEMSEADRLAIAAGTSGDRLMEAAGEAVAKVCLRVSGGRPGCRILLLCGPGNNGGDGFVAARRLREQGCDVAVAALDDIERYSGDARSALARWNGPVIGPNEALRSDADLMVDALFGAGLSRRVEGVAATLVEKLNAARCPVVAVDVPSGVEGDSGRVMGLAVRATETVTFFRLKPAHWLLPGRRHCGRITLADIGIMDDVLATIAPQVRFNAPAAWGSVFPFPTEDGHKYSRGHVAVVSGAMPTLGAARLAARGAARVGAGLVTVASPEDALAAHAAHLTSIMLRGFEGAGGLADILSDARKNAVVLGPGLGVGERTRALVAVALRPRLSSSQPSGETRAVVLDADALTSFADDAVGLGASIAGAGGPVVVTPHDGEFAWLFGRTGEAGSPSKLVRARAAARILGAVVVLKGADTVVAAPDGRVSIACAEAPWLATAGSGDVLSGLIGGLLAQRMPAFEAVSAAVWLHAEAARRFGPGLMAEDLPDGLPSVLRALRDAIAPAP